MNSPRSLLALALTFLTCGVGAFADESTPAATVSRESKILAVTPSEELSALANVVNLPAWTQVAASADFASIEEHWSAIYSPRDDVGSARNWSAQLAQARAVGPKLTTSEQRRWLDLFLQAGEAIARQDAPRFASAVRGLAAQPLPLTPALAANAKFFTAK